MMRWLLPVWGGLVLLVLTVVPAEGQTSAVTVVDSFNALREGTFSDAAMIQTRGHDASRPGQGSSLYVRDDTAAAPGSGNEIKVYDAAGQGWRLVHDGAVNLAQLGAVNDFDGQTGTDIVPHLQKVHRTDIHTILIAGDGWFLGSDYQPASDITLKNGGGGVIYRSAKGRIVGGTPQRGPKIPFTGRLEIGDKQLAVSSEVYDSVEPGDYLRIRTRPVKSKLSVVHDFIDHNTNDIENWGCQEQLLKITHKAEDQTLVFDDRASFLYDFDDEAYARQVLEVVEGFRCEGLVFKNVGEEYFGNERVVANIKYMPGCVFKDNTFHLNGLSGGIFVERSKNAMFSGNTFYRGRVLDIFIRLTSPSTSIINNSFFDHVDGDGSVFIETSNYNIVITGNKFDAGPTHRLTGAIQIDTNVSNCTISNNVINGYGFGIRLELGAMLNTVTGNTIAHCGINGIRMVSAQKNIISNNILRDNGRWKDDLKPALLKDQTANLFLIDSHDVMMTNNMVVNTLDSENYREGGIGFHLINAQNCVISNNFFTKLSIPVALRNTSGIVIADNRLTNMVGRGEIVQHGSTNNHVRDNLLDAGGASRRR